MMIAEAKPLYSRRPEGLATLLGSTQSCHFATPKKTGVIPSAGDQKEASARRVNREQSVPNWTRTRGKGRVILSGEGLCRGTQRGRPLFRGGAGRKHPAGAEPRTGAVPGGRGRGEVSDRSRGLLRRGSRRQ